VETAAIETAKLLATGSVQLVLAIGFVFSVGVAIWLGKALYSEMKNCNAQMLALTEKKIDSDNKLANAIEGMEQVVNAALSALRRA
jgi:hypothetical protein